MTAIPEDVRERAIATRNNLCLEDETCQSVAGCHCLDIIAALILSEREAAQREERGHSSRNWSIRARKWWLPGWWRSSLKSSAFKARWNPWRTDKS